METENGFRITTYKKKDLACLAFVAAGIGNLIRTKLIKHHFTLFLNIAV